MKILHVIPYFVPAWDYGGPLQACYWLSRQLIARGHEVVVYTTDTLNAKNRIRESEEVIDGIKIRRFKNLSNTIAYAHNISIPPGMFLAVKKEIKNFDIIHMHEYRTVQNLFFHHYAQKYAIPYVLQAQGSVPRTMGKEGLKYIYDWLWGYKLLKDASKLIAVTETEIGQYHNMGVCEDKIEIVPNGIDASLFENLPSRGEFRKKYGLTDNQKIILYLGRIHKIKGLDLLVKAFAGMTKELGDTKLVVVGPDDGYLPALKELIKKLKIEETVLYIGPLYGRDKLEAYIDSDVYVLPSIYEILGITILEACACSIPVIVTDRCGIANMIDGQAGLVVPCNKEQLQKALQRMLSNNKMRQELGEGGKVLVHEQFAYSKIVEKLEDVYLTAKRS